MLIPPRPNLPRRLPRRTRGRYIDSFSLLYLESKGTDFSTVKVSCVLTWLLDTGTTSRSWPTSRGRPVWWKGSTPSTTLLAPPMMMRTTSEEWCRPQRSSLTTCIFVKVWHSAQRTCLFQFWVSCWSYRLLSYYHVTCWRLDIDLIPLVLIVFYVLWWCHVPCRPSFVRLLCFRRYSFELVMVAILIDLFC